MKRRNGSGRFSPEMGAGEDINPMDGVANLADVMLVFACGIMLALITYWNVDVAAAVEKTVETEPNLATIEDVGSADSTEDQPDQDGLERFGTVYRDPVTGQLYYMEDGNE